MVLKSLRKKLGDGTYKIYVAPIASAYSRFLVNIKDYCQEEIQKTASCNIQLTPTPISETI